MRINIKKLNIYILKSSLVQPGAWQACSPEGMLIGTFMKYFECKGEKKSNFIYAWSQQPHICHVCPLFFYTIHIPANWNCLQVSHILNNDCKHLRHGLWTYFLCYHWITWNCKENDKTKANDSIHSPQTLLCKLYLSFPAGVWPTHLLSDYDMCQHILCMLLNLCESPGSQYLRFALISLAHEGPYNI